MSRATELLEQATPLPWVVQQPEPGHIYIDTHAYSEGPEPVINENYRPSRMDAALIVYAVNRLPDYEAAVDLLEIVLPWVAPPGGGLTYNAHEKALALLARLRDKVPS